MKQGLAWVRKGKRGLARVLLPLLTLLLLLLFTHPCSPILTHVFADNSNTPRHARVAVPVADLRKEPSKPLATLEKDPLEESQLLYGDPVEILEETEGWARVAAVEQPEYTHNKRWEGYPGWMESSSLVPAVKEWSPNLVVTAKLGKVYKELDLNTPAMILSLGTRIMGIERGKVCFSSNGSGYATCAGWRVRLLDGTEGWILLDEVTPAAELALLQKDTAAFRRRLVDNARLFLGDPYYWGGRSAEKIDCSGFIGLAYQANGLYIPRDAHEIWMLAKPIGPEQLLAGDLIFLHDPEDPDRIVHVMMYAGQAEIIESPGTGGAVRQMNFQERLKEAKGRRISFGTYIL